MSSAASNISLYDMEKQHSAFRFGQSFTYDNITKRVARDPYAYFVTNIITEEALGAGFDLIDPETEELLDINEKVQDIIEPIWHKVIQGIARERAYGYSVFVLFEEGQEAYLKTFEPAYVNETETTFSDSEKLLTLQVRTVDFQGVQKEYNFPEDGLLDNVFLLLTRPKDHFYNGRSVIEPIWDILVGLEYIRQGATIFAIRVGAGMRFVMLPPNATDTEVIELKEGIKKWDSINGLFLLPKDAEVAIETGKGTVDYELLKNCLLEVLSTYTKVPMARLKGIEPGQIEGAKVNEEALFDVYRTLQRSVKQLTKWLINRLALKYNIKLPKYEIQWRVRPEVNIREQTEIDMIQAQIDVLYLSNGVKDVAEIRESLGLDPNKVIEPQTIQLEMKDSARSTESSTEPFGNGGTDETEGS